MQLFYPHRLWADLETRSGNPITSGSYVYAEDSEVLLFMYALDDAPVQVWDAASGQPMPQDLHDYLSAGQQVELAFHNTGFDRVQLITWPWARKYPMPPERFYCTMTAARMAGMPGGLDDLCQALEMPEGYSKKDGNALIRKFCIPNATGQFTQPWEAAADWQRFVEYGVRDVVAMREAMRRIPNMLANPVERALAAYSDVMNDRGIPVDRDLANKAMLQADRFKSDARRSATKLVGDDFNPASQKAILEFASVYGIKLDDARGATLEKLLDSAVGNELLPPVLQKVLALRVRSNKASTAKYSSLLKGTNRDDRARGLVSFYGAGRTGRDAGRRFQPQNLARPVYIGERMKTLTMAEACEIIKAGTAAFHVDNPMQLLSDAVRGTVAAPAGKKFCGADLSAIEGRVLPWLMGEDWKTQYFRDLDAGRVKYDGYELAYAAAFGANPETVTKAQRTLGKPVELACFAAATMVVTSNGARAIVDVTTEDLLWDGVEWVQHQGLVARGVKRVVRVDGIQVTPDHLIKTGATWTPAQTLVTDACTLSLALATGSGALRSLGMKLAPTGEFPTTTHSATAGPRLTKSLQPTCEKAPQHNALSALAKRRRKPGQRGIQATLTCSLMWSIDAACSTASHRPYNGAVTPIPLTMRGTGIGVSRYSLSGSKTGGRFCSIYSPLTGGITRCSTWTASTLTRATSPVTFGSSHALRTTSTGEPSRRCSGESMPSKPVYDILNAGPRNRFTVLTDSGALVVHNCGFGGGVGALITFATLYRIDLDAMAAAAREVADPSLWADCADSFDWFEEKGRTYGLSRDTWTGCQYIVKAWRRKHPATVAGWARAEDAFRLAINSPGVVFGMAHKTTVVNHGGWLFVTLPSGRSLVYPKAFEMRPEGKSKGQLAFWGVNPFTKKWGVIYTYSGRLSENITQAVARDVLLWAVPKAEAAGYATVLRVHDELLCEVPDDPYYSGKTLARIMATPHPWCHDLPLNAVGEDIYRYQK